MPIPLAGLEHARIAKCLYQGVKDISLPLLSYLQKTFFAYFSLSEADVFKTILDSDHQSRVSPEGVPVF
ncbi:hypothetical protein OAG06_01230 [Verrucomicrobia bacterium]|jgi:hypothetical protein|nr:hypothetical protein [Verrucomicrobiota bacterium]